MVYHKIPEEDQTKIQVLCRAKARGCLPEVKKLYAKYEVYYKKYQFDDRAKFQLAMGLLKELSEIDIQLVAWLCDEEGNLRINNVVAFTLVDVPDERM